MCITSIEVEVLSTQGPESRGHVASQLWLPSLEAPRAHVQVWTDSHSPHQKGCAHLIDRVDSQVGLHPRGFHSHVHVLSTIETVHVRTQQTARALRLRFRSSLAAGACWSSEEATFNLVGIALRRTFGRLLNFMGRGSLRNAHTCATREHAADPRCARHLASVRLLRNARSTSWSRVRRSRTPCCLPWIN